MPNISSVHAPALEAALDRIRPYLRNDGGDIELVEVADNHAVVRLVGACSKCPSAAVTLYMGVESYLREAVPELEGVRLA
jgi:Fe-S cluster biogenesis protein NfuA